MNMEPYASILNDAVEKQKQQYSTSIRHIYDGIADTLTAPGFDKARAGMKFSVLEKDELRVLTLRTESKVRTLVREAAETAGLTGDALETYWNEAYKTLPSSVPDLTYTTVAEVDALPAGAPYTRTRCTADTLSEDKPFDVARTAATACGAAAGYTVGSMVSKAAAAKVAGATAGGAIGFLVEPVVAAIVLGVQKADSVQKSLSDAGQRTVEQVEPAALRELCGRRAQDMAGIFHSWLDTCRKGALEAWTRFGEGQA